MKRVLVVLLILLVAFSITIYSQPNDARALHKHIAKLNLTDEQKKEVEKIRFDMEKQTIAQRAKLATARVELQQILKADVPDKAAIEKKINEMANFVVQLRMIKVNSWFAVNKLLTPEQQKTWKKVLEKGPALKRQMMSRMGKRQLPPLQRDEFMPE